MATSSQRKGSEYERELAAFLNAHLSIDTCARAPLSGGGFIGGYTWGSDLIGLPDLHVEAKRTERLNIRDAILQAEKALAKTKAPEIPVVITRRNREPTGQSIVALRLADFVRLYASYLAQYHPPRTTQPAPSCDQEPLLPF